MASAVPEALLANPHDVRGARGGTRGQTTMDGDATVGEATVRVRRVGQRVSTKRLASPETRKAFREFLSEFTGAVSEAKTAVRGNVTAKALRAAKAEATSEVASRHAAKAVAGLGAIDFLLHLPTTTAEVLMYAYAAKVGDTRFWGNCFSEAEADIFGFFDYPRYRLTCRIVDLDRGIRYTHVTRAHGTSNSFRFTGRVSSKEASWSLLSQSVVLLGIGVLDGFDIRRGASDGLLIGASRYRIKAVPGKKINEPKYLPEAYTLPTIAGAERDLTMMLLAFSYTFPWPTPADVGRMRDDALKQRHSR